MNRADIIGHLGADPEVRYMPNGKAVTSIRIATTERFKDKETGEKREKTEWHSVSLFDRLGEVAAEYLTKGSLVRISGQINTRKYPDPGGGKDRYATQITARELEMLGSKLGPDGERTAKPAKPEAKPAKSVPAPVQDSMPDFDDDIPF